ncbi:MAG: gas vesicle protein K [Pseudomonadota bacterium]
MLNRLTEATDRIAIDPETAEQDLARVVLGLMAFLRQLMELQAIRRMEAGTLSAAQEEKLGTTLMKAEAAIHDVAAKFGISPNDLALDLGPLGKTI